MMTNDKMIQFVKRWRELERLQKDLDFNKSQWCRDLRNEFQSGEMGDQQFINWCGVELGQTSGQAKELLLRAETVAIVPDAKTWNELGGYKNIEKLQDLNKRDRVSVIGAAKSTGYTIQTVIRQRGLGPKLPEPAPRVINHKALEITKRANEESTRARAQQQRETDARVKQLQEIERAKVAADTARANAERELAALKRVKEATDSRSKPAANSNSDAYGDAVALAQYIARTGKNVPRDILKLITKYTSKPAPSAIARRSATA